MDTRIIALAIPFFFLLIGIEAAVSRAQRVRRYRLHDSITSLGCGVGEQVIVVFTAGAAVVAYSFAEKHLALFHQSAGSLLAWLALFFLVDHSYYWFHRASHRVNVLWAGHAVHHQSEEYNLSTALRQNWIENLLAWPFYVPLAVLGYPLSMFAIASTTNTLYQFWVHTRIIHRLGPAEGVFNTPASHRVHHGINPKYIDKNYGGMFMVWDRIYGTFTPEDDEPVYGTVKPLASWSPLWANIHGWVTLWSMASRTGRLGDKLKVWLAPPDWRPRDLGGPVVIPEVERATYERYDTAPSSGTDRYVLSQFAIVAVVTSSIMWFATQVPRPLLVGCSLWVIAALVGWGGLFEKKPWAAPLEVLRHVAGIGLGWVLSAEGLGPVVLVSAMASLLVSLPLLFLRGDDVSSEPIRDPAR